MPAERTFRVRETTCVRKPEQRQDGSDRPSAVSATGGDYTADSLMMSQVLLRHAIQEEKLVEAPPYAENRVLLV